MYMTLICDQAPTPLMAAKGSQWPLIGSLTTVGGFYPMAVNRTANEATNEAA